MHENDVRRKGRVVFFGAVMESEPALRLLLTSPAEVAAVVTYGQGLARTTSGFTDLAPLAEAHGVPVLRTDRPNDDSIVAQVRELEPDLIVCVGWTRLIGEQMLAVPRRGCVGFHASLLPRLRGRAPVNWAIIRGEPWTGNTMMLLAPGVDTGEIVDQVRIRIEDDDTCATLYAKVAASGAEMLARQLPLLLAGTARTRAQHHVDEPPLTKRVPEMGITTFDRSAVDVRRWINAQTRPYPGAFTSLRGRRVLLWAADRPEDSPPGARPGTILGVDGAGVRVATASGSVRLLEVQEEGSDAQPAAAWWAARDRDAACRFDEVDPDVARWALGEVPCPPGQAAGRA